MSLFDDSPGGGQPSPLVPATSAGAETPADLSPASAAVARFQVCRWRRPSENGSPDCCAHRDVLPLAGAREFDPGAWCPDCRFYKLRRTPKKRSYEDEPFWRP